MNSQPLVSVIIGLYNVERFLKKKCLRDIRQQTYTNLEIILVDDGSTDATGKLIDELSTEDTRIRVIHKQNGGVSSARNAGLDIASGEFIYFCDVDDDLNLNLIEQGTALMQVHLGLMSSMLTDHSLMKQYNLKICWSRAMMN